MTKQPIALDASDNERVSTPSHAWKDETSYRQGERGKIEPRTWELESDGLCVTVTRHIHVPGAWLCNVTYYGARLVDLHELPSDLEAAKTRALEMACEAVDKLNRACAPFRVPMFDYEIIPCGVEWMSGWQAITARSIKAAVLAFATAHKGELPRAYKVEVKIGFGASVMHGVAWGVFKNEPVSVFDHGAPKFLQRLKGK